jgi:hypothetical protein
MERNNVFHLVIARTHVTYVFARAGKATDEFGKGQNRIVMESSFFETTWWKNLIAISTMFTLLWAIGLFLCTIMFIISALKGNYSTAAITVYGTYFCGTIAIGQILGTWSGIAFFGLASPLITLFMFLLERNRRIKLQSVNEEEHETV